MHLLPFCVVGWLNNFSCGATYLRCCVSNDYNFGTVVETSAPLPEDYSTESTTEYEVFLVTTEPTRETTINHIYSSSPSSQAPLNKSLAQQLKLLRLQYPKTTQNLVLRFNLLCVQPEDDDDASLETTTTIIPLTTKKIYENKQPATQYSNYETSPASTTMRDPVCPGSCVAPLLAFFVMLLVNHIIVLMMAVVA
ncbi:hypothetical protein CEXT_671371 [Caerostris extrusa]|uniref:Uncharacterized protein n=1 Tax=Caerostris extrusa TaxID=172846 RepID=A0AAV4WRJ7_CAEEX|nr:hypothetical protein CEXT_671371 [Caerostris extrusa]